MAGWPYDREGKLIPPKRFGIFPLTGGCSEGLDAFRFFFKGYLAGEKPLISRQSRVAKQLAMPVLERSNYTYTVGGLERLVSQCLP